jgi:Carboxypeptidase regulatory-like domain/TonB dependent receptor
MKLAQRTLLTLVGCIFALGSATPGRAQVTTATFYGTVTDSTGAVISGATVTLTHADTGAGSEKTTSATGVFVFDFMRVGAYKLRIEAPGFKAYEGAGIDLTAGQQVRQTFVLEVGALSDTVTVAASSPLVSIAAAEQLQTFDREKVTELPLPRRNFSTLLRIGTGVTYTGDSVRMNGVGKNGVAFSVDGTDAGGNPEGRNSSNYLQPNLIDIMSVEAIQEVHTVKGIAPAEYGNMIGGQVNLLTRSGTNTWRGSLFENFQSDTLNAKHQRLDSKPPLKFNQFGGSIGGPISRDKIFVFGVYEGYRDRAFTLVQENVPTARLRDDMLRATPSYALLLNFLPLPTEPTSPTADIGLYQAPRTSRRDDNHVDLKTDIRLTPARQLAGTYSRGRPYQLVPRHYVNQSNDREFFVHDDRGTVAFTMTGARWTSETRFGYHRSDMTREDRFYFSQFDPANRNEELPFGRRVGRIGTTLGWGSPDHELYLLSGRTWNFDHKYSRHYGKHGLKLGVGIRRDCCQRTNPEAPWLNYTSRDDLVNNIPSEVAPVFGNGDYVAKMYQVGVFVQDDWQVGGKLVLNLGIRYDYFGHLVPVGTTAAPESGFYNPDGLLDQQTFAVGPIRDRNNPYESDAAVNLGPRVGLAFNPDGQGKTVLRGGFGMFFSSQVPGAMWQSAQPAPGIPFRMRISRLDATRLGLKWPVYNDDLRKIIDAEVKSRGLINTFSVFDPKLQNPYTTQFMLGIQRELSANLAVDTGVVGTRGYKFLMQRWANLPDRLTGLRPNPLLNVNYYVDSSQDTEYFSWQSSLRKRLSRNLSGSVHYTWGRALSTGGGDIGAYYQGDAQSDVLQDFSNPRADRGPSTGDVTHYFASEWIYEVPRSSRLPNAARHVLGGWQLSGIVLAQTGEPVTVTQSSVIPTSRPDFAGGTVINSDYQTTLQYLNPAAFVAVPVGTVSRATIRPGNVGVGSIRVPGYWNVDISLAKNIPVGGRMNVQLRSDMFNAFNRTNLTGLRTNINDRFFGQLLNTRGARVIQLGARVSW